MNNFFTHPMRPFFVGAAILAIVVALMILFEAIQRWQNPIEIMMKLV
jgi:uncharacterized protein involved in response to NO